MCTTVAVYSQQLITYCTVHVQSIHIWERIQNVKKQERQKCPAGTRQTDGKNWGLVWRNRKKISQIIKDYFHLPFFLLIILWQQTYSCHLADIREKFLIFQSKNSYVVFVFVSVPIRKITMLTPVVLHTVLNDKNIFAQGGSPTPHPFSSRPHFVCKFSRQRSTEVF